MKDKKPSVICLTPVRNEVNNLYRFLKCASLWADQIIISDQNSGDGSLLIASKYPKVKIIKNTIADFDELKIRSTLFNEARKIKGPKILLAVDADEILTPNFLISPEWNNVLLAKPGTVIKSKRSNLLPDLKYYWDGPFDLPWGFVDDGSEYKADKIHTNRNIYPDNAPILTLKDIKIIHYQYTDWKRMERKHMWYQCWERINNPDKSAVEIYRGYHHMYALKKDQIKKVPIEWFENYDKLGIDVTKINKEYNYYWDKIVLNYFEKYGVDFFSKEAIWDLNWVEIARFYGYKEPEKFIDPRKKYQKIIHNWLKKTQSRYSRLDVRIISKILKIFFGQ